MARSRSWLKIEDREIALAEEQFQQFKELLLGKNEEESKHYPSVIAVEEAFKKIREMRKVTMDEFIQRDANGNIVYDRPGFPAIKNSR